MKSTLVVAATALAALLAGAARLRAHGRVVVGGHRSNVPV